MAEKHKQKNTFIVQIEERENASWQGSVIWADARRKKYFRSALELFRLIHQAVEQPEQEETELPAKS